MHLYIYVHMCVTYPAAFTVACYATGICSDTEITIILLGTTNLMFPIANIFLLNLHQQNYYEILNVSFDASQKEIKQTFIRLSKHVRNPPTYFNIENRRI